VSLYHRAAPALLLRDICLPHLSFRGAHDARAHHSCARLTHLKRPLRSRSRILFCASSPRVQPARVGHSLARASLYVPHFLFDCLPKCRMHRASPARWRSGMPALLNCRAIAAADCLCHAIVPHEGYLSHWRYGRGQ